MRPLLAVRLAIRKRSEEHTSELQSRSDLVCRLLLEKKKKRLNRMHYSSTLTTCRIPTASRTHWRRSIGEGYTAHRALGDFVGRPDSYSVLLHHMHT